MLETDGTDPHTPDQLCPSVQILAMLLLWSVICGYPLAVGIYFSWKISAVVAVTQLASKHGDVGRV